MSDEQKIRKAASSITYAILALYDLGDLHFPALNPLVHQCLAQIFHLRILEDLADGPEGTAPHVPDYFCVDDRHWCP